MATIVCALMITVLIVVAFGAGLVVGVVGYDVTAKEKAKKEEKSNAV